MPTSPNRPRYGISITTPPTVRPVTVPELKAFCRVDIPDDDALIESLGFAATRLVELHTGLVLLPTTFLWTLDSFFGYEMPGGQFLLGDRPIPQQKGGGGLWPYLSILRFPRHPLRSVAAVNYIDATGASQLLDPSQYQVDANSQPGRLSPSYGNVWPVTREIPNAVSITFVSGFADAASVPDTLKTAVKLTVANWYANRETMSERLATQLPHAVMQLLSIEDVGYYR